MAKRNHSLGERSSCSASSPKSGMHEMVIANPFSNEEYPVYKERSQARSAYWRMHKGSESLAEKKIPPLVNSTIKTAYKLEQAIELFCSISLLTVSVWVFLKLYRTCLYYYIYLSR